MDVCGVCLTAFVHRLGLDATQTTELLLCFSFFLLGVVPDRDICNEVRATAAPAALMLLNYIVAWVVAMVDARSYDQMLVVVH